MIFITIQDVAKKCGVSVATVSRVINDAESVRPETKEKVLAVIKELNYQPNFTGRNLRIRHTKLILVVLPTIVNPFFAKVVKGIEDCAKANGYNILICTTYENKEIEYSHLKLMKSKLVDGVVFFATSLNENEFLEFSSDYPVVQCSEYYENTKIPYVSIDNEQAAFEATTHLIEKGCKKILELSVDNNSITTTKRHMGYIRALKEANLEYSKVIKSNYGYRSSLKLVDWELENSFDFDGIFAISDKMAAGAIRALINKKIKVPHNVKVVGFDNTEISYTTSPEITTVSQSQYDMGYISLDMLIKRINKENVNVKNIINHKLIIRDSTKGI